VTDGKLSLTANSAPIKTALNASGSAPIYACRAWVNFNGTGTVAIRASGNVSSITDNGTGDYTVNFTTAMVDVNYSYALSAETVGGSQRVCHGADATAPTTTAFRFMVFQVTTLTDTARANVAIFR
jgi:hypothetical protein